MHSSPAVRFCQFPSNLMAIKYVRNIFSTFQLSQYQHISEMSERELQCKCRCRWYLWNSKSIAATEYQTKQNLKRNVTLISSSNVHWYSFFSVACADIKCLENCSVNLYTLCLMVFGKGAAQNADFNFGPKSFWLFDSLTPPTFSERRNAITSHRIQYGETFCNYMLGKI